MVVACGLKNTLLYHPQLDIEYLLQVLRMQRMEDHDLIDTVDELRRKSPACRLYRGAVDFVVKPGIRLRRLLGETHGTIDKVVHLIRPKVRSHHNYALREVDTAIVAERERRLVKNSEQQLP